MKKLIFSISFILLSVITVYAQFDIKDYLDYEMPDLKRHELLIDIGFMNDTHSFKNSDTIYSDRSSLDFENLIHGEYSFIKNTRKYIGKHWVSIENNLVYNKRKIDGLIDYKSLYLNSYFSAGSHNVFYMKNKWFYSFIINTSYSLNFSHKYDFSSEESIYKNTFRRDNTISSGIGLSFGKGRIEDITDVIHAMVLIKNLKKNDRIDENPSPEKIKELSRFISKIKNERFFDSRHKKIYELEQVDSFLRANNFINDIDIKYFTTLEDIWVYAGNYYRSYGSELSFSIYSNLRKDLDASFTESYFEPNLDLYIRPQISFNITKPLNLKIQSNFWANIGYNLRYLKYNHDYFHSELFSDNGFKNLYSRLSYSFNFYPNTRTVFESGLGLSYSNYKIYDFDETLIYHSNSPFNASFFINSYYYISPKVRFFIDSKLRYNYIRDELMENNSNVFDFTVTGGFQISLR